MKNYTLALQNSRNFLENIFSNSIYIYMGKPSPWGSPDIVSIRSENPYNENDDHASAYFAKRLLNSDFSLVTRRVNWEETVFDEWDHADNSIQSKNFYCMTELEHVYKCLDNNNGAVSTVEPFGVATTPFRTSDGYLWKYLYSLTTAQSLTHLSPSFMPVKELFESEIGYEAQYATQISSVSGTVDRIEIIQNGNGYRDNEVDVVVHGDGSGAIAVATVHPITGAITGIEVTDFGSGYTYANVEVVSTGVIEGSDFFGRVIISPYEGHGFNAAKELFAHKVEAVVDIIGDEGGILTSNVDYRKLLLVSNPQTYMNTLATLTRYDNVVRIDVSSSSGTFVHGETFNVNHVSGVIVTSSISQIEATEVLGQLEIGDVITGETSGATATVTNITEKPLIQSGEILFRQYINPRNKEVAENLRFRMEFTF